jgi:hypothetical protein
MTPTAILPLGPAQKTANDTTKISVHHYYEIEDSELSGYVISTLPLPRLSISHLPH